MNRPEESKTYSQIQKPASQGPLQGWVLYDGDCGICKQIVKRFAFFWQAYRFEPVPLQTPWVKEKLGLAKEEHQAELLREMRVLTQTGQIFGGAEAVLFLARQAWWSYPVFLFGALPLVKPLMGQAYRWVAKNRHCSAQGCSISHRPHGRH